MKSTSSTSHCEATSVDEWNLLALLPHFFNTKPYQAEIYGFSYNITYFRQSTPSPNTCWSGDRAGKVREGKEDDLDGESATQPLLKLAQDTPSLPACEKLGLYL